MLKSLQVVLTALVLIILAASHSISETASSQIASVHEIVYGEDNRQDMYEVSNPAVVEMAHSTVALMHSYDLVDQKDGTLKVDGTPLATEYNLCSSEKFTQQSSAAFCSGALIGPDLVLTAGHCITSGYECAMTRFVFGFEVQAPGQERLSVPDSEVYSCAMIMHREQDDLGADFALIKLDRQVQNHAPLALRPAGVAERGDEVFVIGHPSGLPTKVASGTVSSAGNGYFVAGIDAYEGNSGSPVFSAKTGLIEGILVRGENDYVMQNGCNITSHCTEQSCRGEDATDAQVVTRYLGSDNDESLNNSSTSNTKKDQKGKAIQTQPSVEPGTPPPPSYNYDDEDTLDA